LRLKLLKLRLRDYKKN